MINNSYLLGLYGVSTDASSSTAALLAGTKKAQPTPPWDSKAVVPAADVLVRQALGGRKLINENAATIDVGGASADYRKLFALYQGLESLNALTNRAGVKNLTASEQSLLAKRFASGLAEIGGYVSKADLDGLRLVQKNAAAPAYASDYSFIFSSETRR